MISLPIKKHIILVLLILVSFPLLSLMIESITERYEDGTVKREYKAHHDTKFYEKLYRKDGSIEYQKNYNMMNDKFGVWVNYDNLGEPISYGNFIIGESEDSFFHGVEDGYYIVKYENGSPKIKAYFIDNLIIGLWEEYYENGNLKTSAFFDDTMFKKDWKEYHENGIIKHKEFLGKKSNYSLDFDDNGLIERVGYYKNYNLNSSSYFKKGIPRNIEFKEESSNRSFNSSFYENGSPKFFGIFDSKSRYQTDTSYYPNGLVKMQVQYGKAKNKEGFYETGLWKMFYENGNLKQELYYNPDLKKFGLMDYFKEYHENGNMKIEAKFDENNEITSLTQYDESGNVATKFQTKDDLYIKKILYEAYRQNKEEENDYLINIYIPNGLID